MDIATWPETMVDGRNQLTKPVAKDILEKMKVPQYVDADYKLFGDGASAVKIVNVMESYQRIR